MDASECLTSLSTYKRVGKVPSSWTPLGSSAVTGRASQEKEMTSSTQWESTAFTEAYPTGPECKRLQGLWKLTSSPPHKSVKYRYSEQRGVFQGSLNGDYKEVFVVGQVDILSGFYQVVVRMIRLMPKAKCQLK